jgi:hypothetical protein
MYGAIASWSIYQHTIIMSRVRFVFLIVVTTLFSCEQPVTGEQLEEFIQVYPKEGKIFLTTTEIGLAKIQLAKVSVI